MGTMYYTVVAVQLVVNGLEKPLNTNRCEGLPCGRPRTACMAELGEPAFFCQAAITQVKTA
jgi:hypothetical protein